MPKNQCTEASRYDEDDFLKFKQSIKMMKKLDLSDLEHDMVAGAKWDGLTGKETADLLGFSSTPIDQVYIEWPEKGQITSEKQ